MSLSLPAKPALRWPLADLGRSRTRFGVLFFLILLQGLCVAFFLGDVVVDFMAIGFDPHTMYEALATLALIFGIVFASVEMWHVIRRQGRAEAALQMAAGAFGDLLHARFGQWGLTPAESDVALLTLKGFAPSEIARLRGTADGTVRAQLGGIYAKSDTHSSTQFVSLFIEALLDAAALKR